MPDTNQDQWIQDNVDKIWELVELFFEAKRFFFQIYHRYEEKVLQHAEERGVDRTVLRLGQDEVSKLLDFSKLVELRNHYLLPLKDLSHDIFRRQDSTDRFDRWVNSIFHEISILKEEHYKVKKIAAEYEVENEKDESIIILDEVHEAFPRIIHHVFRLFDKANDRLDQILPQFNQAKVLIRSTFIFGQEILSDSYEKGLNSFYEKIYPDFGPFEGYVLVAQSFLNSGFYKEAREAITKAEKVIDEYRDSSSARFQELAAQFSKIQYQSNQVKHSPSEVKS